MVTNSELVRKILQSYTNLCMQYIKVWTEKCLKVFKDITVMEFVGLKDRPGMTNGEPWSEGKAYVARILDKVGPIVPRRSLHLGAEGD